MEFPRHKILLCAVIMEGGAFVTALLLARYFGICLFPLSDSHVRDILVGTSGAVAPFLLFLFTLSEKARRLPVLGSLRKTIIFDVRSFFLRARPIDLILISLIAGFGEEALFRGVLQAHYGIVAASLIFGLLHCVSAAYCIAATIMGFYIGVFFIISGSLLVPVQVHVVYDLAALVYLKYYVSDDKNGGCV